MPRLSIVVPIYKVEKYLEQCVQSILGQTFPDFELILVDDGSPDNCPKMCDQWAAADARVRVIHKVNGGLRSAIITGTAAANGTYVGYVDGDDWISPDYYENLMRLIELHEADLVSTGWTFHDGVHVKNKFTNPQTMILNNSEIQSDILNSFWERSQMLPFGHIRCSKVWRSELLKPILPMLIPGISMGEDMEQTLRYLPLCQRIVIQADYAGYFYRVNPSSITRHFSEKVIMQYAQLKEVLQAIALEQARNYQSKAFLEAQFNFDCLYQMYATRQSISFYIQHTKAILQSGPIRIPSHISPIFAIGFRMLQSRLYLPGTLYLKVMFFITSLIYG